MSEIVETKALRKDIDDIITRVKNLSKSRETSLAITKLQEGCMWLGQHLHEIGCPTPYPNSKNPESGDVVEPRPLNN